MSVSPNNNATQHSTSRVSKRFCAADSDVTLQSSDNVLFKVHRRNLAFHFESFAGAEAFANASTSSEDVCLSESAAVLDLLLRFMYRQRQPDLGGIDFHILADLTEAAEKHEVYAAMTVCNLHMGFATTNHPAEVLTYAFKHDYPKLMDRAAPLTVDMPLHNLMAFWAGIPTRLMMIWMKYYFAWQDQLTFAHQLNMEENELSFHPSDHRGGPPLPCAVWGKARAEVVCKLGGYPGTLRDLWHTFDVGEKFARARCPVCHQGIMTWRDIVQDRVHQLPKFSSLL